MVDKNKEVTQLAERIDSQSAVALTDKQKLSLYKKSQKSGYPIDVLEEVYSRGIESWTEETNKTPEQYAFGRVNSFIAGGKAMELDEDLLNESTEALKKKSASSGISTAILRQVYKRGVAAWRTGHRPGTTPQQWGMARVNSFITGGKTRRTADKDLWAKHKGKAVKEEFELEEMADKYKTGDAKTDAKRKAHFEKGKKMDDNNPKAYRDAPGDADARSRGMPESQYTKKYREMYSEGAPIAAAAGALGRMVYSGFLAGPVATTLAGIRYSTIYGGKPANERSADYNDLQNDLDMNTTEGQAEYNRRIIARQKEQSAMTDNTTDQTMNMDIINRSRGRNSPRANIRVNNVNESMEDIIDALNRSIKARESRVRRFNSIQQSAADRRAGRPLQLNQRVFDRAPATSLTQQNVDDALSRGRAATSQALRPAASATASPSLASRFLSAAGKLAGRAALPIALATPDDLGDGTFSGNTGIDASTPEGYAAREAEIRRQQQAGLAAWDNPATTTPETRTTSGGRNRRRIKEEVENAEAISKNPNDPASRFMGSDELVAIYKEQTPGQSATCKAVKDVVKEELESRSLNEKAESIRQQRLMGAAYAYKTGKSDSASPEVKKIADSMSVEELKKFASTKHKGLPEKVDEESITEATYKGKTVKLNKPFRTPGSKKKFAVYVDVDGDGKAKIVRFGDPNMSIKKDQPNRKKSYCARSSGQGNLKNKESANYWSRKMWDC